LSGKHEFKVILFIAALVFTVGIGLGAYHLHSLYKVEKPLISGLNNLPSVVNSTVEKKENVYLINISLGQVENLQEEFEQLDELARSKLGEGKYRISINRSQGTGLDQLYYDIQPIIYEALANNHYVWMHDQLKQTAAKDGLEYKMYLDEQRVYLQFSNGKDYQYYVIDRYFSKQDSV